MNPTLEKIIREIPLEQRIEDETFANNTFFAQNGIVPDDYIDALTIYHGGAGSVGTFYVDLWEPKEIFESNKDYRVEEFAPGFTIFGSDGGDVAFAFERTTGHIYEFPFVGMTMDDPASLIGESFEEFLVTLKVDVE